MRYPLIVALTTALAACTSGGKPPGDTDSGDVDSQDTDAIDTDLIPADTDAVDSDAADTDAADTDAADTDSVDTDAVDTDAADTDVVDTDPGDTDTGDSGGGGGVDTDVTDTDTGTADTDTTDTDTGVVVFVDLDLDGVPSNLDCDDNDPLVFPGASNLCNGVDLSCGASPIDPTGTAALQDADGAWTDVTVALSSGTFGAPASYDVPTDARLRVCGGTWAARMSAAADATIEGVDHPKFDQGSPFTAVAGYGGGVTIRGIVVTGSSTDASALLEVSQGTALVEDVELIGRVNAIAITSGGELTLLNSAIHGQTGNALQLWAFGTPASATVSGVDVYDVGGTAFVGGADATLTITDTSITDAGKGVQTNGTEVTVTDVTMSRVGQAIDGGSAADGHFLRVSVIGQTTASAWYGRDLDITSSTFSSGGQGLTVYSSGALTLTDDTFTFLDAPFSWGGALYFTGATGGATVTDCTFELNNAYYGAAVFAAAPLDFVRTHFTAQTSYGGGAVYLTRDAEGTTFDNISATANEASSAGGVIYSEGSVTVTNSTLANNSAGNGGGGAIFANNTGGGTTVLTGNSFDSNSTSGSGGAVYTSTLTSTSNTYTSNSSAFDGGAIYTFGSRDKVVLTNDSFVGNSASVAGGAIAWYFGVTVVNSTFDFPSDPNTPYSGAWVVGPVQISLTDGSFVCNNNTCQ